MRQIYIVVATFVLVSCTLQLGGQDKTGAVCVAPSTSEAPKTCAPGFCASGALTLKIDDRNILDWPQNDSVRIDNLQLADRHHVTVYRAGKPQQSFAFQFSDYKSPKLCLFLNDLYWTAQLWEQKKAPWCKCR